MDNNYGVADTSFISAENGTGEALGREYRSVHATSIPEEAWRKIDDRMIRIAKAELVGVRDLQSRGDLVRNTDGIAFSILTTNRMSEVGNAKTAMSPDTRGENHQLDYDTVNLPMYVTYKDFIMNTKMNRMSDRAGIGLRMDLIDESVRSVSRLLEYNLFVGDLRFSGVNVKGYIPFAEGLGDAVVKDSMGNLLTAPTAPTGNWHKYKPAAPVSWAAAAKNPEDIFNDVNQMIYMSMMQNHFGPWVLYIPYQYETKLNEDYYIGSDSVDIAPTLTIRQRLMQLSNLEAIRMSRDVPMDKVVLVEMQNSTVEIINGMPWFVGDWEPNGTKSWNHLFKCVTIMVPFLKYDRNNQTGIIVGDFTT